MNQTDKERRANQYTSQLSHDPRSAHLGIIKQRCKWLTARIEAKRSIGWEVIWDTAERDALAFAITELESPASSFITNSGPAV